MRTLLASRETLVRFGLIISKHSDAPSTRIPLLIPYYYLNKRHRAPTRKLTEICNPVFPPPCLATILTSARRSPNRHHAIGHRQVLTHRVPGVFRLLQSDVLDHLSPHQRRGRGRSRAARGGQVNDKVTLRIEKGPAERECEREHSLEDDRTGPGRREGGGEGGWGGRKSQ